MIRAELSVRSAGPPARHGGAPDDVFAVQAGGLCTRGEDSPSTRRQWWLGCATPFARWRLPRNCSTTSSLTRTCQRWPRATRRACSRSWATSSVRPRGRVSKEGGGGNGSMEEPLTGAGAADNGGGDLGALPWRGSGNAFKFTRTGGIWVSAGYAPEGCAEVAALLSPQAFELAAGVPGHDQATVAGMTVFHVPMRRVGTGGVLAERFGGHTAAVAAASLWQRWGGRMLTRGRAVPDGSTTTYVPCQHSGRGAERNALGSRPPTGVRAWHVPSPASWRNGPDGGGTARCFGSRLSTRASACPRSSWPW